MQKFTRRIGIVTCLLGIALMVFGIFAVNENLFGVNVRRATDLMLGGLLIGGIGWSLGFGIHADEGADSGGSGIVKGD